MRFKWTGKRFEWFKSTLDMWGTIAPPDPDRFAQPADVYLDIGRVGRCVRNLYVENLLDCTGTPFNLSGVGGGTVPSGNYATVEQGHVQWAASGLFIEGLGDVSRVSILVSGHMLGFNGTLWVNTTPPTGDGGDNHNIISATHSDTTGTPSISGNILSYDGSNWRPASPFFQPSGYQVPSGNYTTVEQGHNLWQVSGNLMTSGDYATVTQGHNLWMASGIFEASGIAATLIANHIDESDPHTQYLTEAAATTTYQVSGANLEAAGDLSRVSTLVSGHQIGFNGTSWVNTTPGGGGGASALPDLTDVTLGTLVSGHHLSYNGTEWINADESGGNGDSLTITSSGLVEINEVIFNSGLTAPVLQELALPAFTEFYDRIEIHFTGKSDRAADGEGLRVEFNGDHADATYRHLRTRNVNGTLSAFSLNNPQVAVIPATLSPTDETTYLKISINDPMRTSFHKQFKTTSNYFGDTNKEQNTYEATWENTAAISGISLYLTTNGSSFTSGTRIKMIGYRNVYAVNGTLGSATVTAGLITV